MVIYLYIDLVFLDIVISICGIRADDMGDDRIDTVISLSMWDILLPCLAVSWSLRKATRSAPMPTTRGLNSFSSQLNFDALYGIGGARSGCVSHVKGVLGGI